ncbi:SNF2 family DNA-dependent ATPase [Phlegmacium glaucopus]|nr:SNF2 family DNA-dependent ATPase [Phlegmacium glaucopus]
MKGDVLRKQTSLLDALDQSFPLSDSPAGPTQLGTPITPVRRQRTIDHYFEAGSSSSKNSNIQEQLRIARRVHDAEQSNAAASLINSDYLATSMESAPPARRGGGASGFGLNYDHETPLRAIDFGGPDQGQRLADFVAKSIENTGDGLSVKEAMKKLGLNGPRDLLPGLEVRLLNHQVIGVAWMLDKERSQDRGGILADDMGLGKTVQMIATMAMNMPALEDECRTTLIVVPAALLQQWKDEIETKSNNIFKVHIHHGKDKLKKLSQVASKDVIITSYQTLCLDFNIPRDVEIHEETQWLEAHGGILAQVKFHRAVADEAQFIRNRATRASTSLAHVRARYRWMLTGTPVTNTLADIYGLLRFGRFRPWNDWNGFNTYVARVQFDDAPLAGSRAQAILKPILLRRTKNSRLEGKPLLELPPKEIEIVKLQFSDDERQIYNDFENSTKLQLNKFIRAGTLLKHHAAVLVMILRLRQLCCHPYLILSLAEEFEDPTLLVGSDADKELSRARKVMGAAWVAEVKQRFLIRAAASELLSFVGEDDGPDASCPNCNDMFTGGNGRVLVCGHELCFDCTLDLNNSPIAHNGIFGEGTERENLAVEKEFEAALAKGYRPCPTCKKMVDLKSTDKVFKSAAFEPTEEELREYARSGRRVKKEKASYHAIKMRSPSPVRSISPARSIPDVLDDSDDDLPDVAHMLDTLPKKRKENMQRNKAKVNILDLTQDNEKMFTTKRIKRKAYESDSDLDVSEGYFTPDKRRRGGNTRVSSASPGPSKGKGKAGASRPDDGPSDAVIATWGRGDDDLEPSTKMLALIDYLREWDSTGDKTICYSQWTSVLDLIETLFSRHGIRSLRFDGKMGRFERDATLATFKQIGGPKVILISTKCGSVGLNLVSANRVVNMDLSWNYAAESQAYDRCHRIGQEKTVHVKRLVVENTIEERMLLLQDVKIGLADAALGEGQGAKLHKLSVKDIKYLFGMGPKETNGRPQAKAT